MKRVEVINIDGSAGEGGGQILRSALGLALVTGKPFRITGIRAGRAKPGLLRQHLTAVRAAIEIGDGVADGAEIGSRELVFRPGAIRAGDYRFAVGTAGSTTLVLQTILPALMLADGPSRLVLEGGTHNPLAPSFDFLTRTFLPQLARFGPTVEATLVRPGFAPAGGGRMEIAITPCSTLQPVELLERGADGGRRVVAHVAGLPARVAARAFERFEKRLGWAKSSFEVVEHPAECGPGFVLTTEVASALLTESFTGFGERGVRAEGVADKTIDEVRRYLAGSAPVGEYLADQLLLPFALAGQGSMRAVGLTPHTLSNIEVIQQFLAVRFMSEPAAHGGTVIRIERC